MSPDDFEQAALLYGRGGGGLVGMEIEMGGSANGDYVPTFHRTAARCDTAHVLRR
jgi:hypothetical protein